MVKNNLCVDQDKYWLCPNNVHYKSQNSVQYKLIKITEFITEMASAIMVKRYGLELNLMFQKFCSLYPQIYFAE